MTTKICCKCKKELNISCFNKRSDFTGYNFRCKTCQSIYSHLHYIQNKERKQKLRKINRSKNMKRIRKVSSTYDRYQFKNNINFKLRKIFRSRLYCLLQHSSNKKYDSAINLIGCTIDELKVYLESKFLPGMTWNNHSNDGWHIDHIIPCSFFDLSDYQEQKFCFHYTNLQPLWAKDNLIKHDSLIHLYS